MGLRPTEGDENLRVQGGRPAMMFFKGAVLLAES